jgi:hypothetical protein
MFLFHLLNEKTIVLFEKVGYILCNVSLLKKPVLVYNDYLFFTTEIPEGAEVNFWTDRTIFRAFSALQRVLTSVW